MPDFRRALEAMREGGLTIALDDVGLGQSNYKMILDVRPDIYKLDRYLVAGAWNDPYRQVILDSLARMVRRLEAKAVAEGVEDQNELVAVEAAGIDLVQGFLLARPLPRRELLAAGFLAGHAPWSRPFEATVAAARRRRGDRVGRQALLRGQGLRGRVLPRRGRGAAIVESDAPFDAIVCDLHLHAGAARGGSRDRRAGPTQAPGSAVLLFTGATEPSVRNEALRLGANAVITKPTALANLHDAVMRAMRSE